MLIGEFKHTLDDKNRVSLPSKFRKEVGKKIIVTHGLDNCLFLYTLKDWEKIAEQFSSLSVGQAETRAFNRYMLGSASEVLVDSAGRILIPENLKEVVGLKNKVVFAGLYNRIEIWQEEEWDKYKAQVVKNADQMAEKLGQIGAI
ncbi:MAG: division/cell wall cluster transcriptional repressor MraZ [Candidatus Paceibacterota bacterium]